MSEIILLQNQREMIVDLLQKPFVQMVLFILLTILTVFVIRPKSVDHTWAIAGFVFIGFMLVNSAYIIFASNSWSYFFYSLLFSALYLISMAVLIPVLIKLLKIEGSAESAMIFIYIIYHPIFLLFVIVAKWAYLKLF